MAYFKLMTVILTYGAKEHEQTQTQNTIFSSSPTKFNLLPYWGGLTKSNSLAETKFNMHTVSHPLDQSERVDCYCSINPVIIPTNMTPLTQTVKRQQHKPLHTHFQSGCCWCFCCEWSKHIEEWLLWIMIQYFPSLTEISLTTREKCEACLSLYRLEQWGQSNAEMGILKW